MPVLFATPKFLRLSKNKPKSVAKYEEAAALVWPEARCPCGRIFQTVAEQGEFCSSECARSGAEAKLSAQPSLEHKGPPPAAPPPAKPPETPPPESQWPPPTLTDSSVTLSSAPFSPTTKPWQQKPLPAPPQESDSDAGPARGHTRAHTKPTFEIERGGAYAYPKPSPAWSASSPAQACPYPVGRSTPAPRDPCLARPPQHSNTHPASRPVYHAHAPAPSVHVHAQRYVPTREQDTRVFKALVAHAQVQFPTGALYVPACMQAHSLVVYPPVWPHQPQGGQGVRDAQGAAASPYVQNAQTNAHAPTRVQDSRKRTHASPRALYLADAILEVAHTGFPDAPKLKPSPSPWDPAHRAPRRPGKVHKATETPLAERGVKPPSYEALGVTQDSAFLCVPPPPPGDPRGPREYHTAFGSAHAKAYWPPTPLPSSGEDDLRVAGRRAKGPAGKGAKVAKSVRKPPPPPLQLAVAMQSVEGVSVAKASAPARATAPRLQDVRRSSSFGDFGRNWHLEVPVDVLPEDDAHEGLATARALGFERPRLNLRNS